MLNNLLKKAIIKESKEKQKSKEIDTKTPYLFISLGIRLLLIYLFFIFTIGNFLAKILNFNNLYFLSIIIATIVNIYIIKDLIKKNKNK